MTLKRRVFLGTAAAAATLSAPLVQAAGHGKPRVVEKLKSDFSYKKLVHIGDGATDMWAYPPAVSHCATSIRGYCTKAAF